MQILAKVQQCIKKRTYPMSSILFFIYFSFSETSLSILSESTDQDDRGETFSSSAARKKNQQVWKPAKQGRNPPVALE